MCVRERALRARMTPGALGVTWRAGAAGTATACLVLCARLQVCVCLGQRLSSPQSPNFLSELLPTPTVCYLGDLPPNKWNEGGLRGPKCPSPVLFFFLKQVPSASQWAYLGIGSFQCQTCQFKWKLIAFLEDFFKNWF